MRAATAFFVFLGASLALAAPVPQPNVREAAQLVEKLGSSDFTEREAATKRLDELGILALDDLRAACKSENPEIAERAKDLVRKIERRISSERALAPTMVIIDAKDTPLDAILSALSDQAGCEVVLGGLKPDELAGKKVSVNTGKVPFWTAILAICDAADLQVANVGAFTAPGSMPYLPKLRKPGDGVTARTAALPHRAVVLEARDGTKKRPASVNGAALIETFELPRVAAAANMGSAVLQVWPEPKLAWYSSINLKITKSVGRDGVKLVPDHMPSRSPPKVVTFGDGITVRDGDGISTTTYPGAANLMALGSGFTPNAGQMLVRLKTSEPVAGELVGSVYGMVRSPVEPLATITLDPQKPVLVAGAADTEVTASLRTDETGKRFVDVKLVYEPVKVLPARTSDELVHPGDKAATIKPGARGNQTLWGLRVTDADGKAFDASIAKVDTDFVPKTKRIALDLQLELTAEKGGPTVPAKMVFWGTYLKPVEVPFALEDVPLVSGK